MGELFEKILLNWIVNVRSNGIPVTNNLITYKATILKNQMYPNINCIFSNGWIEKFKDRHDIVRRNAGSKIVKNEDCEIDTIINFIELVNEKINSGDYFSIINIDELGIQYDPTINFTLDIRGNKRIEIKKNINKQRITIILGIDFMNKINIDPFIIFKGKSNKCLKGIPLEDGYKISYQQHSWCT